MASASTPAAAATDAVGLAGPVVDAAPAATAAAALPPKSHQHLLLLQMIAGSGSGAITKTATAPLERIKIIFQIQVGFALRCWRLGIG